MTDQQTASQKSSAIVFLRTDAGEEKHEVPAGATRVFDLKVELGVPAAETLFEKVTGRRVPLANEQTIEVKNGLHFEAIGGGGVS
jgi:hypothetical protein